MERNAENARFLFRPMNIRFASLVCLLTVPSLLADSVTLKNGQEIKGDVISDGPDGVLIDYYVTATIKDQRLVPKDEIAGVSVIPPDEKAFVDLGRLDSPPNALDTSFHDALIEKKIPEYLAKYPYSRHLGELRAALGRLESERSRIRQGDRKVDGSWITVASIESDPYQSTAKIQFAAMKEKAQANDPVASLQGYELIEKNYPGSRVLPDAVDAALKQLDVLQEKLIQALINYDIIDRKRQKAIATAPADQAKEIRDALEKDAALSKAAMAAAQVEGTKFFPVFSNNKAALEALKTLIDSERARLLLLQKTPMREGIKASDEATALASAGKTQQARDQLVLAQKLWPDNRDLAKLSEQLDRLAADEAAEAAGKKAQPPATPSSQK